MSVLLLSHKEISCGFRQVYIRDLSEMSGVVLCAQPGEHGECPCCTANVKQGTETVGFRTGASLLSHLYLVYMRAS